MVAVALAVHAHVQVFLLGLGELGFRDVAEVTHTLQDQALTCLRTLGVDHRVHGAGRLGQSGQHGGLRNAHVLQRFAKVDARRTAKTIGALPQIDLVHVQLQDLVLAERALDFVGQHDLGNLARKHFFFGQIKVARHLHGDGGRTLFEATGQVGNHGARHAFEVHATVFVKARVFNG